MQEGSPCPSCAAPVSEAYFFCPNCGSKLKYKPPSTSIVAQIGAYCFAFFLPPFGLWRAVRYLRESDPVSKRIGIVIIVLTAISLALTVWLTADFVNELNRQMKALDLGLP